jgi:hypothetical protein
MNHDGPLHRDEGLASDPLGDVSNVRRVLGAVCAASEMRAEHSALELRQLAIELERDLRPYALTHH